MELRRRYQSLYIPSDFFDAVFTWVEAFPMTRPFQLNNACNFHILHKEVDPLVKNTAVLDPPDANHTYSAKVWLSTNSVSIPFLVVDCLYIFLRLFYGQLLCFAGDAVG